MKKVSIILITIFLLLFPTIVSAEKLNLNMNSSKNKVKVDENFTITVSWDKPMQATGFSVKYDAEKLEFVKCEGIGELYNDIGGEVVIVWFATDDTEKTSIDLVFKGKKDGKANISTKMDDGFADKNLTTYTVEKEANLEIEVKKKDTFLEISLRIVAIIIAIVCFARIIKYNKK